MKRYEAYKHSGVEWIGEVPEHWEVLPIKRCASVYNGSTPKAQSEYWDGEIYWITPSDIGNNGAQYISDTQRKITETGLNSCGCRLSPAHSIVITNRAPIGNVVIPKMEYTTNQGCKAIVPKGILTDFLFHFLSISAEPLNSLGQGSTFMELSTSSLEGFFTPIPPLPEQNQIVEFLDNKTSQIDTLIDKKQRKIELLKEYRTALINQVVSKGLDPNVPMKDSGVEWIGSVPEHWELLSFKYTTRLVIEKGVPENGSIKISPENIESNTGRCLNYYAEYEGEGMRFIKDDVLLNKLRLYLRKVFYANEEGFSMGEMIVLRPQKQTNSKFIYYLLFHNGLIDYWDAQSTGVKMPRVSPEIIMNAVIPLPPIQEQIEIGKHIDKKFSEIELIITSQENKINLLKEYRQSLISNVITGKVDVRKN